MRGWSLEKVLSFLERDLYQVRLFPGGIRFSSLLSYPTPALFMLSGQEQEAAEREAYDFPTRHPDDRLSHAGEPPGGLHL